MSSVRKGIQGFTLIEMVVVIVLIGILAAVAMPRFYSFTVEANQAVASATATELTESANILYAKFLAGNRVNFNMQVFQGGDPQQPSQGWIQLNMVGYIVNGAVTNATTTPFSTTAPASTAATTAHICADIFTLLLSESSVQAKYVGGPVAMSPKDFLAVAAGLTSGTAMSTVLPAASVQQGTTGCAYLKPTSLDAPSLVWSNFTADTGLIGIYFDLATNKAAVISYSNLH